MRRFALPLCCLLLTSAAPPAPLVQAQREAATARQRAEALEKDAASATDAAAKARKDAVAIVANIDAAEADITAASARVAEIARLRARQRARLAEAQAPVVELTATLQSLSRRPLLMALVQRGSMENTLRVQALLASTIPEIRKRTTALRREVERGNQLQRAGVAAVAALRQSQENLRQRRRDLARLEARQLLRSQSLVDSALVEGDRALAMDENARELTAAASTRRAERDTAERLAGLIQPPLRPGTRLERGDGPFFRLPVTGRLISGSGELSPGGVHGRGMVLEVASGAEIAAPASGRILFAGPFRSYGTVLIIDHGGGWSSTLTGLGSARYTAGMRVSGGAAIGRAGNRPIGVELRHRGQPVPFAQRLAG